MELRRDDASSSPLGGRRGAGSGGAVTRAGASGDPPVTVLQCEEGGGFVAADIRTRRGFCVGGEFNDHFVAWE
ncbi:hypothetical protein ABZX88_31470 [Kitasatospora aureofaciens]|uniref:hypothetical protein n=1 Tax=Kitasatospora aureofaciens TaxID=1894 RepID=UPI0033BE1310